MERISRVGNKGFIFGILLFLLSFCIYLKTLAPTVTWGDSGEFITVIHTLGIAHPPGYPLYILLGKLFTLIPIGTIAYRVNMMSAFFGALSVVVVYLIVLKLQGFRIQDSLPKADSPTAKGFRIQQHIPAFASALIFAFSKTFWSYAVVAEVYTLKVFLITLLILILLTWRQRTVTAKQELAAGYPLLYLFAFIYGLSFGVHTTMIIYLPAFLFLIVITLKDKRALRSFIFNTRSLKILMFFLLGLSIYIYLPLRSLQNPIIDFGNPENLKNFVSHIMGKVYQHRMFSLPPRQLFENVAGYLVSLLSQFTPLEIPSTPLDASCLTAFSQTAKSIFLTGFTFIPIFLGIVGIWQSIKRRREIFIFLLLIYSANVLFFLTYFKMLEQLFMASFLISSIWIGVGISEIIELFNKSAGLRNFISILILCLPIIPCFIHYRQSDKSNYRFTYNYGMNILKLLKENAVIFTRGANIDPLLYLQEVEKKRPDVIIINNFLDNNSYIQQFEKLKSRYPNLVIGSDIFDELEDITINNFKHIITQKLIAENIETHPIYCTIDLGIIDEEYIIPNGLVFKAESERVELIKEDINYHYKLLKTLNLPDWNNRKIYKDKATITTYAAIHNSLGMYFYRKGMLDEAIKEYSKAIKLEADNEVALNSLCICLNERGVIYAKEGMLDKALEELEKAVNSCRDNKTKVKVYYNLGLAYYNKGWYGKAITQYKEALRLDPNCIEAHGNLGIAYLKLGLRDEARREFKQVLTIEPANEIAIRNLEAIKKEK